MPSPMDTKFLKNEKKNQSPITIDLLKNVRLHHPDREAKIFMHGMSMEQFLISGSFTIRAMSSLWNVSALSFNMFRAPLALILKSLNDMKIAIKIRT